MPGIDDSTILEAHAARDDAELLVSWSSTAPAGSEVYQVYRDGAFAWHGRERSCSLPPGPPGVPARFFVGVVDASDELTDFGASLPSGQPRRVRLTWTGGSYEGHRLAGFRVYAGSAPGSAVDYAAALATVPAYPGGVPLDGYGLGGYGLGGYGESASEYSWVSAPLAGGVWHFGVRPFGASGDEGLTEEVTATVTAPPDPPGRDARARRLTLTYDPATHKATLHWLSPAP
jgi:hypothetical protein